MRAEIGRLGCFGLFWLSFALADAKAELKAGAAMVDITPTQFPAIVNGGMVSNTANSVKTRLNARAIALSDGNERLAIVVADSCMMPRELLDEAKQLASTRTKFRPDRILISATHTHSAAACMGALGTDADQNYIPLLRQKLVDAIVAAEANMVPAEVGWGSALAPEYTALRQWVRRPDRIAIDPFGNPTVRANMHSARNPDDATGPAGPEDPELTIISVRASKDKSPIAVLSNFSMHYFSDTPISADYFGLFSEGFQKVVKERYPNANSFVAMMSHGCSGDIWRRDYFLPAPSPDVTIETYSQGLLAIATKAYDAIEYQSDASLAMAEARLPMGYRVPDAQRLEWSKRIVAEMGDRLPKSETEVYAREQIILHERQSTEIVLQAIRIGDIAIATTPCETYALTGLKLKLQSPTKKTMVIELANGGDGYIPPPEHHPLGGYNTWAARSAGLEVTAEPKIVAVDLQLLERVFSSSRRAYDQAFGPAARTLNEGAYAYWRLHDLVPPIAHEATGKFDGTFEPGVLFFLEGDDSRNFTEGETNRCVHFAGGRMRVDLPNVDKQFTVKLSFWNGMPDEAREVAGWMFSNDYDFAISPAGIHLGLAGQGEMTGRLILQVGNGKPVVGKTKVSRWTWHQVQLERSSAEIRVYLDDSKEPEIRLVVDDSRLSSSPQFFFGGRSDSTDNWEGRLDEIAVYQGLVGR
jgi:Neutral/alkaline non-lysosomal ceramidase, N-terminal/Concanavalin A-like lectin/glucanases superfamily